MERSLAHLAPGDTGTVVHVSGARATRRRLMEMGLLPGTPVILRRVAPLGDPLELRVRGYSLSLRRVDAEGIRVSSLARPVS